MTPLYPTMLAIEDSVSIACARVVRGMASVEKAVTFRAASARTAARFRSGMSEPEIRRAGTHPSDLVAPGITRGGCCDLQHQIGGTEKTPRDRIR